MNRSLVLAGLAAVAIGLLAWLVVVDRDPGRSVPAPRSESEALEAIPPAPALPETALSDRDEVASGPLAAAAVAQESSADTRPVFGALLVHVTSRQTKLPLPGIRLEARLEGIPENRASSFHASSRGSEYRPPLTDAAGLAVLSLPSGRTICLDAWDERLGALRTRTDVRPLAPLEERRLDLALSSEPDLLFRGELACESRALAYLTVFLRQEGWSLETTATDHFGRFQFRTDSWRRPYLRIEAEGCTPALVRFPALDDPRVRRSASREEGLGTGDGAELAVVDERIELVPAARLVLTARDGDFPAPELPVAARVTVEDLTLARGDVPWPCAEEFGWAWTTDEYGVCQLELPSRVPIQLFVGGHEQLLPALEPGVESTLEFDLAPPHALRGRIVDQYGVPLGGQQIEVELVWRVLSAAEPKTESARFVSPSPGPLARRWTPLAKRARSGSDGRFVFTGLRAGNVLLTPLCLPRADGRQLARKSFPIRVGREPGDEVELVVDCDLFVRGVVVDEHDRELSGVAVIASAAGARHPTAVAETDADGRFEVGPLEHGNYELRAVHSGYESSVLHASAGTDDLLLRVRIPRTEGRIAGFVVDSEGNALEAAVALVQGSGDWSSFEFLPVVVAEIAFAGASEPPRAWLPPVPGPHGELTFRGCVRTDPVTGAFHLEDVVPGDYTLVAVTERAHGFQQVSLTSRRGSVEGVVIHLRDGAELVVELPLGFDERDDVGGEWHLVLSEDHSGEPVFEHTFRGPRTTLRLPPGGYEAVLTDVETGRSDWEACELANGSRARLLFFRHL